MNRNEAQALLAEQFAQYRARAYSKLVPLAHEERLEAFERQGPSGEDYHLEFQFFWDERPGGNLRIVGAIDDRGSSAFFPVTGSLVLTTDGAAAEPEWE